MDAGLSCGPSGHEYHETLRASAGRNGSLCDRASHVTCAGWAQNRAQRPQSPCHRRATISSSLLIRRQLIGAPGEIRTPDLLVRSQTLYPAELRARIGGFALNANLAAARCQTNHRIGLSWFTTATDDGSERPSDTSGGRGRTDPSPLKRREPPVNRALRLPGPKPAPEDSRTAFHASLLRRRRLFSSIRSRPKRSEFDTVFPR